MRQSQGSNPGMSCTGIFHAILDARPSGVKLHGGPNAACLARVRVDAVENGAERDDSAARVRCRAMSPVTRRLFTSRAFPCNWYDDGQVPSWSVTVRSGRE